MPPHSRHNRPLFDDAPQRRKIAFEYANRAMFRVRIFHCANDFMIRLQKLAHGDILPMSQTVDGHLIQVNDAVQLV